MDMPNWHTGGISSVFFMVGVSAVISPVKNFQLKIIIYLAVDK